jgi:hypothetical protein
MTTDWGGGGDLRAKDITILRNQTQAQRNFPESTRKGKDPAI